MIYYFKGSFHPDRINLDISSLVFRFGFGFFETLFYNGGIACHLEAHVDRIRKSLDFYQILHEVVDFEQLIQDVVGRNALEGKHARVNIYYPVENESSPVTPLIAVYPHTIDDHRTFRLRTSPFHHKSHLCAHKTMNYMHFYLAQRDATQNGFDDALLVDYNSRVLETSTSSLLFGDGETLLSPSGPGKLPSVALQVAKTVVEIREENITTDQLSEFKYAYALNSLIGAKPVVRVDDLVYPADTETCSRISEAVLET